MEFLKDWHATNLLQMKMALSKWIVAVAHQNWWIPSLMPTWLHWIMQNSHHANKLVEPWVLVSWVNKKPFNAQSQHICGLLFQPRIGFQKAHRVKHEEITHNPVGDTPVLWLVMCAFWKPFPTWSGCPLMCFIHWKVTQHTHCCQVFGVSDNCGNLQFGSSGGLGFHPKCPLPKIFCA